MATVLPRSSLSDSPRQKAGGGLHSWRLAGFASLAVPIYAAQMPLAVYLPAIYAQNFGLSLGVIGAIFLAERIWGAVADPLIGTLSDRTRSRFGRRRPWIAAGAAIYAIAAVALFFPASPIAPAYLAAALFAFYLGASMIQIPYLAWSGEISSAYHERTRVVTFQAVNGSAALLLVLVLPTIVDQFRPLDGGLKLAAMGTVILISVLLALPLTFRAFGERQIPDETQRAPRQSLLRTLEVLASEKLLLRVLASDFAVRAGQSVRGALFVFFVAIYMGLPHWASGLFLLQFVFGIAAGPIWMKIGFRIGKHRAAIAGELVQAAVNIGLLLVRPGDLPLLLTLTIVQGLAQGSGNLMLRSMVADVADQHRLKTGVDRAALFFSAFSLSEKAGTAAAIGIALPLVGWLGFDPTGADNSASALRGLLYVFALGPAAAHLISAWLIRGFSLDEAEHSRIRRALDERDQAMAPAE
jgi:Na+/melibiose symporter-like transporter